MFFRFTEQDHVKDNLLAKLLRICTFGKMKLEDFKDLISVDDYKMCQAKMEKSPTWYPLTLDVFVKFLYKVIYLLALVFYFLMFCAFILTHISACFRERSPIRRILLYGYTVRPLPRLLDLLLGFGMLRQKPMID